MIRIMIDKETHSFTKTFVSCIDQQIYTDQEQEPAHQTTGWQAREISFAHDGDRGGKNEGEDQEPGSRLGVNEKIVAQQEQAEW